MKLPIPIPTIGQNLTDGIEKMKKRIKTILKARENLSVAYGILEFCKQSLIQLLSEYVDFELDIIYQHGDGFVLLDIESGLNIAPLDDCINVIIEQGHLTREKFLEYCI